MPKLAATMGVAVDAFEAAYWAERDAYDRGQADLGYWTAVGARFGAKVDEALSDELTGIDVAGWSNLAPSSLELLESLSEAGANLALLSNAPTSFGRWVRAQDWSRVFRETLFSGDVHCAKPDPKIFLLLLEKLGAEPGQCLFFDDRQTNVDGARSVGIQAHRWDGAEAARAALG
ncbi:HAD-IA family hydrolase [Amycolatopsis sp. PS_44_ISF1]|uniref:HAD-IA family hydrolase n=1 Tax=Amycolatopsis sp. PS_44_ISF1 TaxID=2974917 RepID=UPI0028DFCC94|nr:HAD-IA family hydrolase [Amycolatopsis sp. PS_44_ISF1]MDT8910674.1 HAD-IA family hydrolase [Amycolatopsis sp. PS_44_ISF1]